MSVAKFTKVESLFRTTLRAGITSTQTTIVLNAAPGSLTQFPQWLVIEPLSSNYEIVYVPADDGSETLTNVVRGINPNSDTDVADPAFQKAHPANVDVILAPMHRHWNEVVDVMDGTDGTGASIFRIGLDTDVDITIYANNGDATPPFFRYDASDNKWLISNDGVSTYDIASGGSGLTRGLGIDIIASAITLDVRASGGLRNNQGTGSQQADVDPAIVARLDTANTWAAVQTISADNLQINSDANSGNDAVRQSYLTATLDARLSSANAAILTGGPASDATALHRHAPGIFTVELSRAGNVFSTANDTNSLQTQAASSPTGDDIYVLSKNNAANNSRYLMRYTRDASTGMYLATESVDISDGGAGAAQYANVCVGTTYVWVSYINAGGTDIRIVRYSRDLASSTVMTISGTANTDIGHMCGNDNVLYVLGVGASTTVAVYTISGTTATRGTNITSFPTSGSATLGFFFDGTDILALIATGLLRINTSGVTQATLTRRFRNNSGIVIPVGIGYVSSEAVYFLYIQAAFDQTSQISTTLWGLMVDKP